MKSFLPKIFFLNIIKQKTFFLFLDNLIIEIIENIRILYYLCGRKTNKNITRNEKTY